MSVDTTDPFEPGTTPPGAPTGFMVPPQWTAARFGAETGIILLSVCLNAVGLWLVYTTHKKRKSVYHILYINISVSNIVACPLTWFCGNVQFFFPAWFGRHLHPDSELHPLAVLLARYKVVAGLAVAVHMNLAMLSLGICQYFAVCRPLQSVYLLQKRRAWAMIGVAWAALGVCVVAPGAAMLARTGLSESDGEPADADVIRAGIIITANTYGCVSIGIYVIMITLALLITASLCRYTRRTGRMARDNTIACDMERMRGEQRACLATAALLASRTLITVPLTIYFIVQLNSAAPGERSLAVFFLSIVPCAKCVFDPFIYGSLTRDVRNTWRRLVVACDEKYPGYEEADPSTKEIILTTDRQYTTA